MTDDSRRQFFISHSNLDGCDAAEALAQDLESGPDHFVTWLAMRDATGGSAWDNQIEEAIRQCTGLLFIMTIDSVADDSHCKNEWVAALDCYKKTVIPLRFDMSAKLPYRLNTMHFIDFSMGGRAPHDRLKRELALTSDRAAKIAMAEAKLAERMKRLETVPRDGLTNVQAEIASLRKQISRLGNPFARPLTVFISHRWEDRVFDWLSYELGEAASTQGYQLDILDTSYLSGDERIQAIQRSTAVLFLVTTEWRGFARTFTTTARDIEVAVDYGIRIASVLFDSAVLPATDDLHPSLRLLETSPSFPIRHQTFKDDVARIFTYVEAG